MNELFDVANALSTPIKMAWIGWLAWGVGQAFWYKRERASAAAKPSVPRPPRRAAAPKRQKVAEPVMGRLITPPHVEAAAPKIEPPAPPAPVPVFEPSQEPVAFDPSKAIVETFDPRDRGNSLDAIVADMEAHMPRVAADASPVH